MLFVKFPYRGVLDRKHDKTSGVGFQNGFGFVSIVDAFIRISCEFLHLFCFLALFSGDIAFIYSASVLNQSSLPFQNCESERYHACLYEFLRKRFTIKFDEEKHKLSPH